MNHERGTTNCGQEFTMIDLELFFAILKKKEVN